MTRVHLHSPVEAGLTGGFIPMMEMQDRGGSATCLGFSMITNVKI